MVIKFNHYKGIRHFGKHMDYEKARENVLQGNASNACLSTTAPIPLSCLNEVDRQRVVNGYLSDTTRLTRAAVAKRYPRFKEHTNHYKHCVSTAQDHALERAEDLGLLRMRAKRQAMKKKKMDVALAKYGGYACYDCQIRSNTMTHCPLCEKRIAPGEDDVTAKLVEWHKDMPEDAREEPWFTGECGRDSYKADFCVHCEKEGKYCRSKASVDNEDKTTVEDQVERATICLDCTQETLLCECQPEPKKEDFMPPVPQEAPPAAMEEEEEPVEQGRCKWMVHKTIEGKPRIVRCGSSPAFFNSVRGKDLCEVHWTRYGGEDWPGSLPAPPEPAPVVREEDNFYQRWADSDRLFPSPLMKTTLSDLQPAKPLERANAFTEHDKCRWLSGQRLGSTSIFDDANRCGKAPAIYNPGWMKPLCQDHWTTNSKLAWPGAPVSLAPLGLKVIDTGSFGAVTEHQLPKLVKDGDFTLSLPVPRRQKCTWCPKCRTTSNSWLYDCRVCGDKGDKTYRDQLPKDLKAKGNRMGAQLCGGVTKVCLGCNKWMFMRRSKEDGEPETLCYVCRQPAKTVVY